MRNDLSKMDAYYVLPNGKRAKGKPDIDRFLKENPEYAATLPLSSFNFSTPKIVKETVSDSAKWVMAKSEREEQCMQLDAKEVPSSSSK